MHLVKFVELRHQFKVFRQVVGRGGLPVDAVQAYVSIVHRLVQNDSDDVDAPRSSSPSKASAAPNYVLANQRKLLSSGALAFLASLMTATQQPAITAMVISIMRETAAGQGPEKIADVLQSNIVERTTAEIKRLRMRSDGSNASDEATMDAALDLIRVLCDQVLAGLCLFSRPTSQPSSPSPMHSAGSDSAEGVFMLGKLTRLAAKFLTNTDTIEGLFQVLHASSSPLQQLEARCTKVLSTICLMTRYPFGFPQVLDLLTRNGGRHMELVLHCLIHPRHEVVSEALALYCEVTDHPHGRQGLTTAGAVRTFMRWCHAGDDERGQLVMGLLSCALVARQTPQHEKAAQSWLLSAIHSPRGRLDALYRLLLDLVAKEGDNESDLSHDAERSAAYFHRTNALPTLVKFLTQVTPTCMEPAIQSPRHRNVSCIVLSRFFRVPQVARACFSEDVVNHLALSLQCNRLDEVEKAVVRYSQDARMIHRLGSKEACKALTRLARCSSQPSSVGDEPVVAQLRPSITSALVPELPQAMICDVMFRLHVVEDLVAYIKPVDLSADSPDVETALTTAAVELAGHLRPLPYGEAARVRFFKMFGLHEHGKYASDKLMLLVEVVAPSILRVLREANLHADLVDACCSALSRLACTNAACSALLAQGCLQTALMHLPEFLLDLKRDKASDKSKARSSEWVIDSMSDEHGLLGVPAALYTLLGKLCAVAEGRTAIMRAQVLPRVLKRLQLHDSSSPSADTHCKSEIAVVISRLAMVNTVEGNSSELFVHFGVPELLTRLLKTHHPNEHSKRQTDTNAGNNASSYSPSKKEATQLRVIDHVLGAIAALSQDLLVCVPKLVALGVLQLLGPFLGAKRSGDCGQSSSVRADSIQLHAVRIIHAVAAYPFGEYHALLASTGTSEARSGSSSKREGRGASATSQPSSLMEQVRRIGFDFAAELRGREAAITVDSKTVGDFARETLAAMNAMTTASQRPEQPSRSVTSPSPHQPRRSTRAPSPSDHCESVPRAAPPSPSRAPASQRSPPASAAAFPALRSPSTRAASSDQKPPRRASREHSTKSLPATTCAAVSPPSSTGSSSPIVNIHPASPVKLNGVDLAKTRPPGKQSQEHQAADRSPAPSSPRFIFATPKPTKRSSARDAAISSLMLDPLFDSSPLPSHDHSHGHHRHRRRSDEQHPRGGDMENNSDAEGYAFVQEIDRFGHLVQVKGRRARRGDRYVPSLGLVSMDSAPSIAFHS